MVSWEQALYWVTWATVCDRASAESAGSGVAGASGWSLPVRACRKHDERVSRLPQPTKAEQCVGQPCTAGENRPTLQKFQ